MIQPQSLNKTKISKVPTTSRYMNTLVLRVQETSNSTVTSAHDSYRFLVSPLPLFLHILLLIFTCLRRWARHTGKVDIISLLVFVIYAKTLAIRGQLLLKTKCLNYLCVSFPYLIPIKGYRKKWMDQNPTWGKNTSSQVVINSASLLFSSCVWAGTNSNHSGSWLFFLLNINLHTYDVTRP